MAKEMAELMERMTVEQIQSHIQKAREILAVGVAADVDKALEEAREAYKGAKEEKAEADDDDFEEEKAQEKQEKDILSMASQKAIHVVNNLQGLIEAVGPEHTDELMKACQFLTFNHISAPVDLPSEMIPAWATVQALFKISDVLKHDIPEDARKEVQACERDARDVIMLHCMHITRNTPTDRREFLSVASMAYGGVDILYTPDYLQAKAKLLLSYHKHVQSSEGFVSNNFTAAVKRGYARPKRTRRERMPDDNKKKALTPGLLPSSLPYQEEEWGLPYQEEAWSQQYNAAYLSEPMYTSPSSYLTYYDPDYMSQGCCG